MNKLWILGCLVSSLALIEPIFAGGAGFADGGSAKTKKTEEIKTAEDEALSALNDIANTFEAFEGDPALQDHLVAGLVYPSAWSAPVDADGEEEPWTVVRRRPRSKSTTSTSAFAASSVPEDFSLVVDEDDEASFAPPSPKAAGKDRYRRKELKHEALQESGHRKRIARKTGNNGRAFVVDTRGIDSPLPNASITRPNKKAGISTTNKRSTPSLRSTSVPSMSMVYREPLSLATRTQSEPGLSQASAEEDASSILELAAWLESMKDSDGTEEDARNEATASFTWLRNFAELSELEAQREEAGATHSAEEDLTESSDDESLASIAELSLEEQLSDSWELFADSVFYFIELLEENNLGHYLVEPITPEEQDHISIIQSLTVVVDNISLAFLTPQQQSILSNLERRVQVARAMLQNTQLTYQEALNHLRHVERAMRKPMKRYNAQLAKKMRKFKDNPQMLMEVEQLIAQEGLLPGNPANALLISLRDWLAAVFNLDAAHNARLRAQEVFNKESSALESKTSSFCIVLNDLKEAFDKAQIASNRIADFEAPMIIHSSALGGSSSIRSDDELLIIPSSALSSEESQPSSSSSSSSLSSSLLDVSGAVFGENDVRVVSTSSSSNSTLAAPSVVRVVAPSAVGSLVGLRSI